MVNTYNGILLSHKKEQNRVICRDVMDLESVIQSEVSQKQKITVLLVEMQNGIATLKNSMVVPQKNVK